MIKLKFRIDIYKWDVLILVVESKKDIVSLKKLLTNHYVNDEWKEEILDDISKGAKNGGVHLHNNSIRKSMIILTETTSPQWREIIFAHEKRHLEDRILEACEINDFEAAAYLAQEITRKTIINGKNKLE